MSVEELNDLEIKEKLKEKQLYKPEMSQSDIRLTYYSFKCKQVIEAEGLYENGMTDNEIKQVYNALKKSQESANNDNEYREILTRTEKNCSSIGAFIDEPNTMMETADFTNMQKVSQKPPSAFKHFPSFPKRCADKQSIKNIDVCADAGANFQLLKLRNVKYSDAAVIYYHQKKILKLSIKERAAEISQYLLNIEKNHKHDFNYMNKWSDPILPQQKKPFNGDLCVDFIPDALEDESENETLKSAIETESPVKDNYISTRSRRVKRKNYEDQLSDEENNFGLSKKTKSNDDLSNTENAINAPEAKWIKRVKGKSNSKTPSYFMTGSDRINKIFDKLKYDDNTNFKLKKKNNVQNLQETLNLSDSDEEIFPVNELVTTANVHEEDQIIKPKYSKITKAKKTSPKKRPLLNKLTTLQKKSATKENESPEISSINFYSKNKNCEVDESNNNKMERNEETTNCPICNRPFPLCKIETHAANCTQYEGKESETFCDICNENILDKKLVSHRSECLKKITEASIVNEKPYTRSQRTGFLCQICDKYICNSNEIQHASSCIAEVQ